MKLMQDIQKDNQFSGHEELQILSNKKVDGKYIGSPSAGEAWHSDLSYTDIPTLCTMLYAVEIPEIGGDTEWSNIHTAYDALSDDTKERIAELRCIHVFDRRRNRRTKVDTQFADKADEVYGVSLPDAVHPMVRHHPETGRKSLYISPRFVVGIEGIDDDEAQFLLDELFEHQIRPEFRYRHRWRQGDLLMWDNPSLIHIGRGNIKSPGIRHMHRTMVLGDRPH